MSITLTAGLTSLTLSEDLLWSDEMLWSRVVQAQERSITGALIVTSAQRTGGRPITLEPPDQTSAWMPRSLVAQLQSWADVPGMQMTLSMRGTDHTVIWRHDDAPALSATPVIDYSDPEPGDPCLVTLKFLET